MSYINEIEYDFKDVCAYPFSEDYTSSLVAIADDATFPRYTALKLNSSTGKAEKLIVNVPTGNPQNQSKGPAYVREENTNNFSSGVLESYTFNGAATKFTSIESISVYGGPYYSPNESGNQIYPTKADFTAGEGSITVTYTYDGQTYFDESQTRVDVYLANDPYTPFVADTDFTSTVTYSTNEEGKKVMTAVITLIASSSLDTALTANTPVQLGIDPYQLSNVTLTEGVDYNVSYVPAASTNYPNAVVTFIRPISAKVKIYYKQPTRNGDLAGITMDDIPATGPRDVGIYTGGTFRKEAIPNFGAYFSATTGFNFV